MMEQWLDCKYRLFFVPFPADSFTCCSAHGENVKDIDWQTGVSAAILKHGLKGILCKRWTSGESICEPSDKKNPFLLSLIRQEGERYLRKVLSNP